MYADRTIKIVFQVWKEFPKSEVSGDAPVLPRALHKKVRHWHCVETS